MLYGCAGMGAVGLLLGCAVELSTYAAAKAHEFELEDIRKQREAEMNKPKEEEEGE